MINLILEHELYKHLTDCLLSIYINISTEKTKYLIFHEPDENNDQQTNSNESLPKRAKLDYDAFINKIKYLKKKSNIFYYLFFIKSLQIFYFKRAKGKTCRKNLYLHTGLWGFMFFILTYTYKSKFLLYI